MKAKGTVRAWTTSTHNDISSVEHLVNDKRQDDAVASLSYTLNEMDHVTGWTEVGVATITVEFFPRESIVSKQIEKLREQLRQHRVNAENAEQAILSQISKLMAITA